VEPDLLHHRVRRTRIGDDARVVDDRLGLGRGGNRITRRMTRLPSGESHGGELVPDPLGLGFTVSGAGDAGSGLGWGGVGGSRPVTNCEINRAPCQGFHRRRTPFFFCCWSSS
jgi:hypothetical protein